MYIYIYIHIHIYINMTKTRMSPRRSYWSAEWHQISARRFPTPSLHGSGPDCQRRRVASVGTHPKPVTRKGWFGWSSNFIIWGISWTILAECWWLMIIVGCGPPTTHWTSRGKANHLKGRLLFRGVTFSEVLMCKREGSFKGCRATSLRASTYLWENIAYNLWEEFHWCKEIERIN